ncbi:hypothetical protein GH714_017847 [Hevea brasiliensis]|uniref:Uncharacterized protein n=1 Tax=Hevea brasiliensis TaxID=3981 RepID=A0A6A6K6Z6_HEVBR|nr:hypothetical protein GH714_017847 [Hevea brasiliensis]
MPSPIAWTTLKDSVSTPFSLRLDEAKEGLFNDHNEYPPPISSQRIMPFLLLRLASCINPHQQPRGLLFEEKTRLGSTPPSCHNKCNRCHPCMAVQVPAVPSHSRVQPGLAKSMEFLDPYPSPSGNRFSSYPIIHKLKDFLASSAGARLVIIECKPLDEDQWRRRLEQRGAAHQASWHKPSTWQDLQRLLEEYDGCTDYDVGDVPKLVVDTTADVGVDKLVSRVVQFIVSHTYRPSDSCGVLQLQS